MLGLSEWPGNEAVLGISGNESRPKLCREYQNGL